jgi:hypothetical protein
MAEYTAMAFRSVPGAVIVGSTTSGADGAPGSANGEMLLAWLLGFPERGLHQAASTMQRELANKRGIGR